MHFPTLLLLVSLTWASTSGINFLSPLTYFTSGFRSLANYKLGTTARLMSYITGDRAVKASVALKIADKPTIVEPDQELVIEHGVPPSDHIETQVLPIPQEVLDKQIEDFKKHFESGYAVLSQANGHLQPQSQTLTISLPLDQYREFVSAGTTGGELMRVAVVTQDVPVHQYSHVPAQHWQHQHSDQQLQQQQFDQQQPEQHQYHQQQPEQHQYHQQFLHQYQQQSEHEQQPEQQHQEPQSQLEAPPTVSHASADQHPDHPGQTELGEDSQRVLPLPTLPGASSSHSHVFPYGWVAPQVPMPSLQQIPGRLSEFQTGLQQQASQVLSPGRPSEFQTGLQQQASQILQQVPFPVAPNLFPTQQQSGSPADSASAADVQLFSSDAQDVVIPGSQFPDPQQLQASGYDVQSQESASHTTEMFGKPNVRSTQTSAESSDATQESIEASTLLDTETSGPSEERRRRSASDDEPTPTAEPESTEFSNATVADDQVEEYFQFIRAHDENQCLARLICMISSEPHNFGAYGKQIDSFFRAYSPRSNQQSAAFYKEAASTSRSSEDCGTRFAQCQMDDDQLKQAVNL